MSSKGKNSDKTVAPSRVSTRKKSPGYDAQTLSQVNLTRARAIASAYSVKNYSTFALKDLLPLIREKMLLVKQCSICANSQCVPETHLFPAVNPYVDGNAQDGNDENLSSGNGSGESDGEDSPSRRALAALNSANNPQDRLIARAEESPNFLDDFSQPPSSSGTGSGNDVFSSFDAPANVSLISSPGSNYGDVVVEDLHEDSDNPEDDPEFQNILQARKEKHALELNTHKNALLSKAGEAAKKKAAQQQLVEREKKKLAKRQQILDNLEAKQQEALRNAEAEVQHQQPGSDDVFSPSSDRQGRSMVRGNAASSNRKNRVGFSKDNGRSHSSRTSVSPSRNVGFSDLLEVMNRQQESMAQQHERTLEVLSSAIKGISKSTSSRVHVSNVPEFGASNPHSCVDQSGRAQVIQPGNPDAAREHGFRPPINWGLQGDPTNIDISKIKKSMTSGKNRSNDGIVIRQHYWPHDCLSKASRHILGPNVKIKHWNQNQTQFTEGFLQKLLIDTPKANMDPILNNKIKFFAMITKLSYTLPWKDILSITEDFFESFEFDQISWDDWSVIDKFVKESYEQVRLSATSRPRSFSAPAAGSGGAPGSGRKLPDDANGVPNSYMKSNFICCTFNHEVCKVQNGGDHSIGSVNLHHWCGGCHKKSNGATKANHSALKCKNGPFGSLFA